MTDAGAPLSRRQRRAREKRDAGPEFDDLATGETDARGVDGRRLSRRERRALERTERPMETWTAEEEMLATGQLPAMTPEVIAAEERNARERAEQAAREAEATSTELRRVDEDRHRAQTHEGGVGGRSVPERRSTAAAPEPAEPRSGADSHGAATASSWPVPSSPTPMPPVPPARPVAETFAWPSGPTTSAPTGPAVDEAARTHTDEEAANPQAAPAEAPTERQRFTGLTRATPEVAVQPTPSAAGPAEPAEPAEPAVSAMPEGVAPSLPADQDPPRAAVASQPDASLVDPEPARAPAEDAAPAALPDILKDLFPAGSPQARMMEEGAAYARAQAESPATRTPIPMPDDFPSRAAEVSDVPFPGAPAPGPRAEAAEPVTSPQAPVSEDPAAEMRRLADAAMANLMSAAPIDATTVDDAARAAGEAVAQSRGEVAPHDGELAADVFHGAPSSASPAATAAGGTSQPFVNLHGEGSTTQVLPPVAPFGTSGQAAAPAAATPSVWERHAPDQTAPGGFNPDDYVPSAEIPMPDLSTLEQAAHPTTSAGSGGAGEVPYVAAPVTDGIEVPRREVPQLQPGHGARDMHWAHFLVIGAVAFVLGLLVYQLAGLGS